MADDTFYIIVETPRGSTEKFNYNEKYHCFVLKKILPAGMVFPFDFGFIPGTKGEDGDPLDALVLSNFKTFPGCMIECRLLGAIKAEQTEPGGNTMRNDRFIFAPVVKGTALDVENPEDFLQAILPDLEAFFVNYNRQEGKEFRPLGFMQAEEAQGEIKKFGK